jgi:hypothetical protein
MDVLDTVDNHTKVDAQEGTVTKSPTTAELRAALADDKFAFVKHLCTVVPETPGRAPVTPIFRPPLSLSLSLLCYSFLFLFRAATCVPQIQQSILFLRETKVQQTEGRSKPVDSLVDTAVSILFI